MIASLESFKERQINAGVYLLNRSGWIILSTYVAGQGSRKNDRATDKLLAWAKALALDVIKVRVQWDGCKESSFLIFTGDEVIDPVELAEAYGQDAVIAPMGLVWASGKVHPIGGVKNLGSHKQPKGDYSEIDGDFFAFNFLEQKFDVASFIINYESGLLDEEQVAEGFQELINSGLAWQLQGHYGRTAYQLIASGDCELPEA